MGGIWAWQQEWGAEDGVAYFAKSTSNLGKNGSITNQFMIRKAPEPCNQLCMDAAQVKQYSIKDEWVVFGHLKLEWGAEDGVAFCQICPKSRLRIPAEFWSES